MNYFKKVYEKIKRDRKLLILILLILAFLMLLIFFLVVGLKLWFWISLALWILFFFGFFKFFIKFSLKLWLIFFLIIFIFSVGTMVSTHSKVSKSTGVTTQKLTATDCKPYFDKYNDKVLKISGDNIVGSIGIKITPQDCQLSARYIITFNAELSQNPSSDPLASATKYNYTVNLHKTSQTERGDYGVGALSLVRQNPMTLPSAFSDSKVVSEYYRQPMDTNNGPTSSFYWSYEKIGTFSQARYQEMLDINVLEVVDGLPFLEKTAYANGTFSFSINHEKAEKQGNIVKTFNLTISE